VLTHRSIEHSAARMGCHVVNPAARTSRSSNTLWPTGGSSRPTLEIPIGHRWLVDPRASRWHEPASIATGPVSLTSWSWPSPAGGPRIDHMALQADMEETITSATATLDNVRAVW